MQYIVFKNIIVIIIIIIIIEKYDVKMIVLINY